MNKIAGEAPLLIDLNDKGIRAVVAAGHCGAAAIRPAPAISPGDSTIESLDAGL
ncbi:MAG: hypothetical protein R3C05_28730 [Pirellulaceae bacterium]